MSAGSAMAALERSRELLEVSPARALRLLPERSKLPRLLRPERDFVEAEARRAMGYFAKAEGAYARLLRKLDPARDAPLCVEAALGSAAGLRCVGAVSRARRRLAAARGAARRGGLRAYEGRLRLEEALVERAAGRLGPSLRALRPLLRTALARRAWGEAAFLLWAVGGAERLRGRLKESVAAFLRSLRLAERDRDRVGEGYACFGLGGSTRVMGRLRDSERWYSRAERIFRGSDDLFARAYAACGRANALRQLGRLDESESLYRKSRDLYARLEDRVDLAYVDWGLGELRLRRGKPAAALRRFRMAERAFRAHNEARGAALCLLSSGRASYLLGRRAAAERLFRKGCAHARKAGLRTYLETFT